MTAGSPTYVERKKVGRGRIQHPDTHCFQVCFLRLAVNLQQENVEDGFYKLRVEWEHGRRTDSNIITHHTVEKPWNRSSSGPSGFSIPWINWRPAGFGLPRALGLHIMPLTWGWLCPGSWWQQSRVQDLQGEWVHHYNLKMSECTPAAPSSLEIPSGFVTEAFI